MPDFLKRNSINLGDTIELMKQIESNSIDLIFADLPYGTTNCKWDKSINLSELWKQYYRIKKDKHTAILLFAQLPFDKILGVSNLKHLRYEWILEKTAATGHYNSKRMPMKAHENLLVFYEKLPYYIPIKTTGHKPVNSFTKYIETQNKGDIYNKCTAQVSGGGNTDRFPRDVISFAWDKQTSKLNSTQKPLALCEYFIKTYTKEGWQILDNTCGSGTVGLACKNLNRDFILIDNDPDMIEKSTERIYSGL
jgi:site-specific DNA-methyltransferase (adenine-specific)